MIYMIMFMICRLEYIQLCLQVWHGPRQQQRQPRVVTQCERARMSVRDDTCDYVPNKPCTIIMINMFFMPQVDICYLHMNNLAKRSQVQSVKFQRSIRRSPMSQNHHQKTDEIVLTIQYHDTLIWFDFLVTYFTKLLMWSHYLFSILPALSFWCCGPSGAFSTMVK